MSISQLKTLNDLPQSLCCSLIILFENVMSSQRGDNTMTSQTFINFLWRHKLLKCFCDMIKNLRKNKICLKSCQICKHKQYFLLNLIYFFTILHIYLCSVLVQFLHQLIFNKILHTLFNHSLKYLNNLNFNSLRSPCAISLTLETTNQLDWVIFNISEQCSEILKRNPV